MKTFICLTLLALNAVASAQKGLDEMVAAEKSFAAYAVANGTREAFLQFADTGSVMFRNGEPVNGYQLWKARQPVSGILHWRPGYAEISASGDFGWTCGPWTFQPQSIADSAVATGYFFTVWQKKEDKWKFILDVGTDAGPVMIDTIVKKPDMEKSRGTVKTMLETERYFIDLFKTDTMAAYRRYASQQIVLAKEGAGLKIGLPVSSPTPTASANAMKFSLQGSGISSAGDLGYTYGSVSLNGKKESYFRIWRHELSGWKMALQMLRL